MKFNRFAVRFAITTIAIVSFSMTSEAFAGGIGGGSWGGSLGGSYASRGYGGGSWGSARNFRTPVRDFFAYRQPVRRLMRGVAGSFRGWGSTGYGSLGSSGYSYYCSGSIANRGYAYDCGCTGTNYIGAPVSSASFSYAPAPTYGTTYSTAPTSYQTVPANYGGVIGASNCADCIGMPATSPTSSTLMSDGTVVGGDSGLIMGDQTVIPAEQYYDSAGGSEAAGESQGSGVRGFETPPSPEPETGETTSVFQRHGDAVLQVNVPDEATQVYVNNRLTTTEGLKRRYVSKKLKSGKSYSFNVEAVVKRNGKEIALTKSVQLRAGKQSTVNFDFDQPVLTQLTVKVPENAKINLHGNETSAKGKVRNFRTRLQPGKTWENYKIAVEIEENGQVIEKTRTLHITAGQKYVVDFSDTKDYLVKN
jgi:uncharacterized protein (TIGR03000 family)